MEGYDEMGLFFRVNWLYTVFINLLIFKRKFALRLPILVGYKTKIKINRNTKISLDSVEFGTIKIGVSSGSMGKGRGQYTSLYMGREATLVVHGSIIVSKNSVIDIEKGAVLEIGKNFSANSGLCIKCSNRIEIGDDCICGWDTIFVDKDGHFIIKNGNRTTPSRKIQVGNHVWIGANVCILKGSTVLDDVVIGAGSLLTSKVYESKKIYAGNPAKIIADDIEWQK